MNKVGSAMRAWAAFYGVAMAVYAAGGATTGCDVSIGVETFREESLVSDIKYPYGLAVDYTSNLLYFSHMRNDVWSSAKFSFITGAVNKIEELNGQCTFAVDQGRQEVHAGCGRFGHGPTYGLYQFDSNVGRFVTAGEAGQPVAFAYYNEVLYYSIYPSYFLHTFRRGHSARVQDLPAQVRGLVIAKHKDRIFYNETGVYLQRAGTEGVTRYEAVDNPRALAVDASGGAYACDFVTGIYRLHERASSTTHLLEVRWCTTLAFDRDDNIIYAEFNRGITRLVKC